MLNLPNFGRKWKGTWNARRYYSLAYTIIPGCSAKYLHMAIPIIVATEAVSEVSNGVSGDNIPPPLSLFINLHIIAWIDLLLLWFWRRLSDGSVTGGCVSKIGISPLPLYLVINIHITVWIDLDGASVATTSSVAALASASGDGGSFLITILNWSDRSGGSGTGC